MEEFETLAEVVGQPLLLFANAKVIALFGGFGSFHGGGFRGGAWDVRMRVPVAQ